MTETDLKRKISEAAGRDLKEQTTYDRSYDRRAGFIKGAMSPEAKALHTQGLYAEEEIITLLELAVDDFALDCKMISVAEWFEQNKKKS